MIILKDKRKSIITTADYGHVLNNFEPYFVEPFRLYGIVLTFRTRWPQLAEKKIRLRN